jgi:acyl carrier protein
MENKLKRLLSVVLDVDEEMINEKASADNIEGWDSLKQMNIIVAIEEEFGILFDEDEAILSNSFSSLNELIKAKQ